MLILLSADSLSLYRPCPCSCHPLAQASLHPSWQHDPLFPTFPLLSSSDVAVLTLAQPLR